MLQKIKIAKTRLRGTKVRDNARYLITATENMYIKEQKKETGNKDKQLSRKTKKERHKEHEKIYRYAEVEAERGKQLNI